MTASSIPTLTSTAGHHDSAAAAADAGDPHLCLSNCRSLLPVDVRVCECCCDLAEAEALPTVTVPATWSCNCLNVATALPPLGCVDSEDGDLGH